MKARRRWVWFLAGMLLGGGLVAAGVFVAERFSVEELQRWHMYTFGYRPPVLVAAQEFYRREGRWPHDVGELVKSGLLPEWSEIYLPPGCVGGLEGGVYESVVPQDGQYHVAEYVTNSVAGVTAHFSKAPYVFREEQGKLVVGIADDTPGLFRDFVLDPPQGGR